MAKNSFVVPTVLMIVIVAAFFYCLSFGILPFDLNLGMPIVFLQLLGYAALCTFIIIFVIPKSDS